MVEVEAVSINAAPNQLSQRTKPERSLAPGRIPIGAVGIYRLTIFLSAFLLFEVEPILVKYLLPWFGGSSAVWTTSLLFFQLILLAGYGYSHVLGTRFQRRSQGRMHLALVLISLALMGAAALSRPTPITPGPNWQPVDSDSPVLHLLALLTVSIGLPYFVLSSTAPLLQLWFASDYRDASPYRLYSLSNLGALIALISYPFAIEPNLSVRDQALVWVALYAGFSIAMSICAVRHLYAPEGSEISAIDPTNDAARLVPTRTTYALWILLAACASLMLLATTSHLTQDVAPIPFLWLLPLALYLLSFIICFENENWYDRRIFHPALGVAVVLGCMVLCNSYTGIVRQIVVFSALLFSICMVCHGELYRLRPDSKHLTAFYLMVSVGGAVGGIFAAIIAPHIFRGYWEFQLAIGSSVVLLFMVLLREPGSWVHRRVPLISLGLLVAAFCLPALVGAISSKIEFTYKVGAASTVALMAMVAFRKSDTGIFRRPGSLVQFALSVALLVVVTILMVTIRASNQGSLFASRNFYGTLAVVDGDKSVPHWHYYAMRNGRIVHGRQYVDSDKRDSPTAYYGPGSGIGLLMLGRTQSPGGSVSREGPLRVGVVGLGVGTVAAYGRPGDYIRYYEINPDVIRVADDRNGYFSFLKDSQAKVEIIPGDARLSMGRELRDGQPQRFDILVVDAFSGDAIPMHLITQEAVATYLKELKPDGVLAFHVTNGYLDLKPALWELARHFKLQAAWVHDVTTSRMCANSDWVLLARNDQVLGQPTIAPHLRPLDSGRRVRLWTDDYSNLFQALK